MFRHDNNIGKNKVLFFTFIKFYNAIQIKNRYAFLPDLQVVLNIQGYTIRLLYLRIDNINGAYANRVGRIIFYKCESASLKSDFMCGI